MKRRDFIKAVVGSTAAWPLVARAQQQPSIPVIGFLSSLSKAQNELMAAWRRGLSETGYIEGKNVVVEYRFAEGQYDRLAAFATEFVRRPVNLIVALAPPAALAAKVATTTIPIVFAPKRELNRIRITQIMERDGAGRSIAVGPRVSLRDVGKDALGAHQ